VWVLCVCAAHSLLVGPRPPKFHFNGCCLCCITHTHTHTPASAQGGGTHKFLILTVARSLRLLSCHLCGDATLTRSHFYFYATNLFLQAGSSAGAVWLGIETERKSDSVHDWYYILRRIGLGSWSESRRSAWRRECFQNLSVGFWFRVGHWMWRWNFQPLLQNSGTVEY